MAYNQDLADSVYQRIMQLPEGEIVGFCKSFAYDLLHTDIDNNRRSLMREQHLFNDFTREQVAKSICTMLDEGAEKSEALAVAAATALALDDDYVVLDRDELIVKASPSGAQKKKWDDERERKAKRDKKGRFARFRELAAGGNKLSNSYAARVQRFGQKTMKDTLDARNNYNAKQERPQSGFNETANRVAAGGKLVASLGEATGVGPLAAAGRTAQYAGSFGAEGEKIVGPALRRTAYRHRGTQREIDPDLVRRVEAANKRVFGETRDDRKVNDGRYVGDHKRDNVSAVATEYLRKQLPKPELNRLHLESGKGVPSVGVVIGPSGEVYNQSVGFAEDHYLPFDNESMKNAKGGAYVRTRTVGGLTTEDINSAISMGVREATVVSHSGVFKIKFSDDFRGARRMSDKAKSMVKRYGQILDTVQSETLESQPLSALERAQIREEVDQVVAENPGLYSEDEKKRLLKQRINEAMQAPRLTADEEQAVLNQAKEIAAQSARGNVAETGGNLWGMGAGSATSARSAASSVGNEEARVNAIAAELREDLLKDRGSRKLRLDSEGYKVALEALAEQYPYFIEVESIIKPALDGKSSLRTKETDKGYVKPRYLHPEAQRSGYFGANIDGRSDTGTKRSGTEGQYQNWAYNPANQGTQTPGTTESVKAPQGEEKPEERVQEPWEKKAAAEREAKEKERSDNDKAIITGAAEHYGQQMSIAPQDEESQRKLKDFSTIKEFYESGDLARESMLRKPETREKLVGELKRARGIFVNAPDDPKFDPRNIGDVAREEFDLNDEHAIFQQLSPSVPHAAPKSVSNVTREQFNVMSDFMRVDDAQLREMSDAARKQGRESNDPSVKNDAKHRVAIIETIRALKKDNVEMADAFHIIGEGKPLPGSGKIMGQDQQDAAPQQNNAAPQQSDAAPQQQDAAQQQQDAAQQNASQQYTAPQAAAPQQDATQQRKPGPNDASFYNSRQQYESDEDFIEGESDKFVSAAISNNVPWEKLAMAIGNMLGFTEFDDDEKGWWLDRVERKFRDYLHATGRMDYDDYMRATGQMYDEDEDEDDRFGKSVRRLVRI